MQSNYNNNDIKVYEIAKPKPAPHEWSWFKKIAIRILFPPLLIWDALKWTANFFFGRLTGKRILAAQGKFKPYAKDTKWHPAETLLPDDACMEPMKVITHDNAHLDTVEICHKYYSKKAPEDEKYIINITGNSGCYELIVGEMALDARTLQCTVIGFNLRGVGHSRGTPRTSQDLITDGIAQVQRLLDQGVLPENITLKGHSLGGAVATFVAKHFHDHGLPIKVFNDRSFSSLTNVIIGRLRRIGHGKHHTGHHETAIGIFLSWFAKPFLKVAFYLTQWELDAADAFKRLPDTHKEYVLIRSHQNHRRTHITHRHADDPLIMHYASLHLALKPIRKSKKAILKSAIKALEEKPTRQPEEEQRLIDYKEKLRLLKERKIHGAPVSGKKQTHQLHNNHPSILFVRTATVREPEFTASKFFWRFFKGTSTLHVENRNTLDFKSTR